MKAKEEDRWSWTIMQMGKDLHVLPTDEIMDHFQSDCPCNPVAKEVENGYWMFTHKSYDGRREELEKLIVKDKMRKTYFAGKAIHKYYADGLERGDAGYLEWHDRPEGLTRVGFFLENVTTWQEYKDEFDTFKIQEVGKEIVEVNVEGAGGSRIFYLVIDFEVFDHLMSVLYDNQEKS